MTLQIADIYNQAELDVFNNVSLGSAGLVEGTNAHTIKVTNATNYRIAGQAYLLAAADNIAMPALAVQANGSTAYYLVVVNAAGTVTIVAPPVARAGDPDNVGLLLGALPAASAVIGVLKVVATAAFTSGTTDLAGQGTFANINSYPSDPTVFTYA
jgi:hypothetical protein